MSRGLGVVQRRLMAALDELGRRFAVEELAGIAFPGEPIERVHLVSVRRAEVAPVWWTGWGLCGLG
jgi:hypothetical protein